MSKNEDEIAWCLRNGATSTDYNDAWREAMIANGATASHALPDMKIQVFQNIFGYIGSLSDMEKEWYSADLPDASIYDYNGTVLIQDLGSGFYGTVTEGNFTPSDSCGLPLLIADRWNSFIGIASGTVIQIGTSGTESVYASIDLTIPEFSATPITLLLSGSVWAKTDASLYTWMSTQVGNTVGFKVNGTPA